MSNPSKLGDKPLTEPDLTEWSAERFERARKAARRGEMVIPSDFLMLEQERQYHMAAITRLEIAMGMEPSDSDAVIAEAIKRVGVRTAATSIEPLATVEKTNAGPYLLIDGHRLVSWLGTSCDPIAEEIAAAINAGVAKRIEARSAGADREHDADCNLRRDDHQVLEGCNCSRRP